MTENIHRGEYLAQQQGDPEAQRAGHRAPCAKVYERGVAAGVFRRGIDPIDLHMSISALSFFNVANQPHLRLIFKRDLDSPAAIVARRDSIVEMVVRFVREVAPIAGRRGRAEHRRRRASPTERWSGFLQRLR